MGVRPVSDLDHLDQEWPRLQPRLRRRNQEQVDGSIARMREVRVLPVVTNDLGRREVRDRDVSGLPLCEGEAASHVVIRKRIRLCEVLSRRRRRDELFGHLPRGRREPDVLLILFELADRWTCRVGILGRPAVVPDLGDEDCDDAGYENHGAEHEQPAVEASGRQRTLDHIHGHHDRRRPEPPFG